MATHHLNPKERTLLGLVMIKTKRLVHDIGEMNELEAQLLGFLIKKISIALKALTKVSWTYCYCFTEEVRHVHTFVAERYEDLPKECVRLNIGDWRDAPTGDIKAVQEFSSKLRELLQVPQPRRIAFFQKSASSSMSSSGLRSFL